MNLKVRRTSEGLPEIEIKFDQDTSDSEPYMVLSAWGFESDDEIISTLQDVAQSLGANMPAEAPAHAEDRDGNSLPVYVAPKPHYTMEQLVSMRKPGETVRDVEQRLMANGGYVLIKDPKPRPFNPQPRGGQR